MYLTSLDLKNFKGRTAAYKFKSGNLIVGLNFDGKTAIMNAVRFVLLGECASAVDGRIFKDKAGAEALASDFPMSATVTLSDKSAFSALLEKKGKGKSTVFTHEPPDWLDEQTRLLLNPDLYFRSTGPDRIKLLARCLSDREMTIEEIMSKFFAVELPDASIAKGILDELRSPFEETISDHTILSARIEAGCEWLRERKKTCAASEKRMQATAAGLTDLGVIEQSIAELPTLAAVETALSELREKLTAENVAKEKAKGAERQRTSDMESAKHLRDLLGKDFTAERAKLVGQIDALTTALASGAEGLKENAIAIGKLTDAHVDKRHKVESATQELEMVRADMELGGSEWSEDVTAIPADDIQIEVEGIARVIGGKDKPIHVRLDVIHVRRWRVPSRAMTPAESAQVDEKTGIIEALEMERDELGSQLEAAKKNHAENDALQKQTGKMLGKAREDFAVLEAQIAAQGGARKKLEGLEDSFKTGLTSPSGFDASITTLTDEIAQQEQVKEKIGALAQDRKRVEESQAESAKIRVEIEIITAMLKVGAGLSGESADNGIDAALKVANQFCDGVLKTPLVWQDGAIGRMDRGLFVDSGTFSGAEALLCRMSLVVALAVKGKLRVVLLDELSILDLGNKEHIIKNLDSLVKAKLIDQWFAADNDVEFWKGEKTVNLIKP